MKVSVHFKYLIVIAVLAAFCIFMLQKSCNNVVVPDNTVPLLKEKIAKDSIVSAIKIDSLTGINKEQSGLIGQLSKERMIVKIENKAILKDIDSLKVLIEKSKSNSDTAELVKQYEEEIQNFEQYVINSAREEFQADSIIQMQDERIARDSVINSERIKMYNELHTAFYELSGKYENLSIKTGKLKKKKRIGVGLQVGVGMNNQLKPGYYVGAGISYNIFNF